MSSNEAKIIDELIENQLFFHSFQPIYHLSTWDILGYEAFLRSNLYTPDKLFEIAVTFEKLFTLDSTSFSHAISTFFSTGGSQTIYPLFVNIYPSTLLNPSFTQMVEHLFTSGTIPKKRIVLEINESEEITDMHALKQTILFLRKFGIQVALDDVGKGSSSMQNIIELEPDIIKLDNYFSNGLAKSYKKQLWLKLVVEFCKDTNSELIIEGIEKAEDLHAAKKVGVHFGQGYLLGMPKRFGK